MIGLYIISTYLSVISIVQTLITQVMLSTRILYLHLSTVLLWLLLLMVRLLLLVVMLLYLLYVFTLLIFLSRVTNVLHLASIIVIELLEILLTWPNHHAWILTATTRLALAREGHILVILLSNCCIGIISRWLHKLILRIQDIDILEILAWLLEQLLLTLRSSSS